MWLSGIGLKIFAASQGLSSAQLAGVEPAHPGVIADAVSAGVLPLTLVIALCIAFSYVLLKRLVDHRVAVAAACLLALDPFYITYSKALHVDALLATFMVVSALFLLNHLHGDKRSDLLLSGLFGGLAFLTKSPSVFLLPYTGLAVGAYGLVVSWPGTDWRQWTSWLWKITRTVSVWASVVVVVFVVLWPAMWVQPLYILDRIGWRIASKVETPHENPAFFNGQVAFMDPGPLFYLATIGWKTTLVTLPMMGMGIVFAALQFRQKKRNVIMWLFVAFAFFFTIQMCLGARKELRYLLPVFPALDIVAAFGAVWTAEALSRVRWLPSLIVGVALALQAGLVLPRHPYYGTLHNRLLGGAQAAQHIIPFQDQAEGLDLAGQYLNTLPRAQRASACVHPRGSLLFKQHFIGLTNIVYDPLANYRVYFVNQVMRQLDIQEWRTLWEADRQTEPLWTVAFDGVPYVWIYGAPPEEPAAGGIEYNVDYQLGEHIELKQARLSAETLALGDTLTVVLGWESDGNVERNYKVFCHVLSEDGELVAQQDGIPLYGIRPTPSWRAGEIIEDSYEISPGGDLAPGEYELLVGMYDAESMERLSVYDSTGERLSGDRILLGSLRVEEPEG
jgi:4-amino-4-deoxy-L-arabinose transferase-like glycosyltransferase